MWEAIRHKRALLHHLWLMGPWPPPDSGVGNGSRRKKEGSRSLAVKDKVKQLLQAGI